MVKNVFSVISFSLPIFQAGFLVCVWFGVRGLVGWDLGEKRERETSCQVMVE